MSSPTALAAVTATLRQLLKNHLPEFLGGKQVRVTTNAPNQLVPADAMADEYRLNLFLYHVLPNAAWRNQAPPGRGPGVTVALAPLALDAYYLITAVSVGDETTQLETQQLLGQALAILHDVPILGKDSIRLDPADPPLDFYGERLRIVPQPLTVDEISKLWSAFQAPYRLSAAIQASVVLIDSAKAVTPAPPVLSRGGTDQGTDTDTGLEVPYPQLTAVGPVDPAGRGRPVGLPVFEAGEVVRLTGGRLRTGTLAATVTLTPAGAGVPIDLVAPSLAQANQLDVMLKPAAALPTLRAGLYSVSVDVQTGDPVRPTRTTNELPLLVAPRIDTLTPAVPVAKTGSLTVGVTPRIGPGQRVSLLVGAAALEPVGAVIDQPTLTFALTPANLESGRTYPVRVRVDGVDNFPTRPDKPREFANTVTIL